MHARREEQPPIKSRLDKALNWVIGLSVLALVIMGLIWGQRQSDRIWSQMVPDRSMSVTPGTRAKLDECKAYALAQYFRDGSQIKCPR